MSDPVRAGSKRSILVVGLALGLGALGAWLALQSPILARAMADSLLREQGPGQGMATDTYLALLAAGAAAYRLVGAALLAVGLWWTLRIAAGPE
jgi:hypothetical protein